MYSDQEEIDRILSAEFFDEEAVKKVLFNRLVIWGFQEYAGIFREAWKLNRGLEEHQEPFRIVGLNVRTHHEFIEREKDARDPDIVKKVFQSGVPEVFMAETILAEFVRTEKNALVYTNLTSSFTDFEVVTLKERAEKMELPDNRHTGAIISDSIGDRAATVLMHSPWPYTRAQTLFAYPLYGILDEVMDALPGSLQQVGFDTADTPVGVLSAGGNDFVAKQRSVKLQDMCDGYILLGSIKEYTTVTPYSDFIHSENFADAIKNFPGPEPLDTNAEEFNTYVANMAESTRKALDRF